MGRSPRIVWLLLGAGFLWSAWSPPPAVRAQPLQSVPLECRIGTGTWQACQMDIKQAGRHWFLQIGPARFEFTHDGTGRVRLGKDGVWTEVTPRWDEDQSLCWGTVCARGEFPLD